MQGAEIRRQSGRVREDSRQLRATAQTVRQQVGADRTRRVTPTQGATRPETIAPGQWWALWVQQRGSYEHLAVLGVAGDTAVGQTGEGRLCAVTCEQLLGSGDFLGLAPGSA